jgi:hypothetical protein
VRTRRRYKLTRWMAAGLGGLAAALAIWPAPGSTESAAASFPVTGVAIVVAVAAVVPWLIVEALWRRKLRRNYWDWQ